MQEYKIRRHWRIFNVLVRIFGIMATCWGIIFFGAGIYYYFHPTKAKELAAYGNTSPNYVNPDTLGGVVVINITIGFFCVLIGTAILLLRAFRPDQGDNVSSNSACPRNWWTVDPKS